MPTVDSNGGRGGEVVYAVATKKAMLMPDLRDAAFEMSPGLALNSVCRLKRVAKEEC